MVKSVCCSDVSCMIAICFVSILCYIRRRMLISSINIPRRKKTCSNYQKLEPWTHLILNELNTNYRRRVYSLSSNLILNQYSRYLRNIWIEQGKKYKSNIRLYTDWRSGRRWQNEVITIFAPSQLNADKLQPRQRWKQEMRNGSTIVSLKMAKKLFPFIYVLMWQIAKFWDKVMFLKIWVKPQTASHSITNCQYLWQVDYATWQNWMEVSRTLNLP